MEVRGNDGKGPLLFEWDSDSRTIYLIRKDKFYKSSSVRSPSIRIKP